MTDDPGWRKRRADAAVMHGWLHHLSDGLRAIVAESGLSMLEISRRTSIGRMRLKAIMGDPFYNGTPVELGAIALACGHKIETCISNTTTGTIVVAGGEERRS